FGNTIFNYFEAILVFILIILVFKVTQKILFRKYIKKVEDLNRKVALKNLNKIVSGIFWIIALLFALSNLGVNVSSLVAGLGIGGIAVAFALQSILGDLFSSFVIYFDKPFVVGDYIKVGKIEGNIEKIGIKSTRLRSIGGEEVIISNKQITSKGIQNFGNMKERRVRSVLDVSEKTSLAQLKEIPQIIEEIINNTKDTRFVRAIYTGPSNIGYKFRIVYLIEITDLGEYLKMREEINFKILAKFKEEKINLAFSATK
ncbi:MAG: mechanosensitive ion channel family protein, partial [Patescibacteria group bacterium]